MQEENGMTEHSEPKTIELRRLTMPVLSIGAIIVAALIAGGELRSLRLAAETGAASDVRILAEMEKRPTSEGMQNALFSALRPYDAALADVQAQLRSISSQVDRVQGRIERLEDAKQRQ